MQRQRLYTFALILVVIALATTSILASPWNSRNDPSNFGSLLPNGITYNLKTLPSKARLSQVPWADTYWPSYLSGIAFRWASPNPQNFNYNLNTKAQLKAMTRSQLVQLSPAEKFDIYVGRYDYPTVRAEWQRTNPDDQKWEGICHGWAVAALQYSQPNPVSLTNPDGIAVPFASSDVKALLDYFVAEYAEQYAQTAFIGDRCNYDIEESPQKENVSSCADLNAGAFHVMIANMLSQNAGQGFVGDRDRSIQVWNQPIFSFKSDLSDSRPPSPNAAPGTASEVFVETVVYYTLEMRPQYTPISNPTIGNIDYRYWLELDAQSNVIGGSYQSWERLDFSWMQLAVTPFTGFFTPLQKIYSAAINGTSVVPEVVQTVKPRETVVLVEPEGELRSSPSGQNYTNDYFIRWSIAAPEGQTYSSVEFEFVEFSTERHRDKLRIYEGAEGNGAMVGVFHGTQVPSNPFVVHANGAVVVFKSDMWGTDKGFHLRYRARV